jgi:hypothetical protein
MSYFDSASLVFIPSGYKTSKAYSVKPTDGTGDLTFTRSNDTATRVGPDGLIEKVRTNLLLQSNSFDTTWNLVNGSLTSGQSGYDGTSNAWLLAKNATAVAIVQNIAVAGLQSFSTYAKAGTTDWVRLGAGGGTFSSAYFDLTNGVVGATTTNIVSASISSVGSGWYRCTIVVNKTINAVYIYPAEADNDVSATSGNILIQAAQLETGDLATDYIATTSAAVSVGPVANVPRLDYLGSSCPRLLLEPQRTNSILWSEQMNNWGPTNTTVTTNVLVSPDGYQNADTIVINDSTSRVSQNLSLGAGTYTASVYAKLTIGSGTVRINLIVDGVNSSFTFAPTNEWERYTYTVTAATGVTAIQLRGSSGTSTVSFWGAQIEAGSLRHLVHPHIGSSGDSWC